MKGIAIVLTDEEKKKIDVLLAEYQACHTNRNHYDSNRWIIGSIFIATSLALFGISFLKDVKGSFTEVTSMAIFSILLIVIWHAYNQHVNPYVMLSIERLHDIESELYKMGFDVRLNYSILKRKQWIRGAWITYFLLMVVLGVWILRLTLFFQRVHWKIAVILLVISAVLTYIVHIRILNATDWGEKYNEKVIDRRRGK